MQEICDNTAMTASGGDRMIPGMRLPSALTWLIDEASSVPGPDQFLTTLGAQLVSDGLPLSGGALTLAAPHPIIARRAWLWRAQTGAVIEALGFQSLDPNGPDQGNAGRDWLAGLGTGLVHEYVAGPGAGSLTSDGARSDRPVLGWLPRDPSSRRNPRCCKRWRGSLLRLSVIRTAGHSDILKDRQVVQMQPGTNLSDESEDAIPWNVRFATEDRFRAADKWWCIAQIQTSRAPSSTQDRQKATG